MLLKTLAVACGVAPLTTGAVSTRTPPPPFVRTPSQSLAALGRVLGNPENDRPGQFVVVGQGMIMDACVVVGHASLLATRLSTLVAYKNVPSSRRAVFELPK
jgi:hypothetical protein